MNNPTKLTKIATFESKLLKDNFKKYAELALRDNGKFSIEDVKGQFMSVFVRPKVEIIVNDKGEIKHETKYTHVLIKNSK